MPFLFSHSVLASRLAAPKETSALYGQECFFEVMAGSPFFSVLEGLIGTTFRRGHSRTETARPCLFKIGVH
jgi:hypothetical protein